jgi:carbamate kinase
MLIVTALERALAARGSQRQVAALISRVLVAADDPAWQRPTKPIGGFVDKPQAGAGTIRGLRYQQAGTRGWRRVVPSPEPLELLDAPVLRGLVDQDVVVVAAGGGGIPMVREDGRLRGVEAVLDKDLTAVLLARAVGADTLVIATDVDQVSTAFGTPSQRPIGRIAPAALRALADAGHFASGSMGPKVEAAIRFVTAGSPGHGAAADQDRPGAATAPRGGSPTTGHSRRAVISSLARLADAVAGKAGTIVETTPDPSGSRPAQVSAAT